LNSGSVKLFTIFGIPVDINATWLLAFALITWSFSTSWFPALAELPSTAHYWIAGVLGTLALFTSVLAHELGHSLVALSQGLRVCGITLLLFGGVSRIEGGATRARNEFLIAFAGPAVSIVIGLVLLFWVFVLQPDGDATLEPSTCYRAIQWTEDVYYGPRFGRSLEIPSWRRQSLSMSVESCFTSLSGTALGRFSTET
jgi:Zn-dependent protease